MTSLPDPYYQDEHVTIYNADCRELMPLLTVDAVVTDQPYGIRVDEEHAKKRAGRRDGKALAPSRDYGHSSWDSAPPTPADFAAMFAAAPGGYHIFFGGNYFDLPPQRGWLVWDKDNGSNGYADCELAWTNLDIAVRKFTFRWQGMLQQIAEPRWHIAQKPLPVMRWALTLLPETDAPRTILDPYMGSGTTLRAAKDLNLHAIGIDAEERYCQIAAERMAQEVLC